jgi:hypothetical protein
MPTIVQTVTGTVTGLWGSALLRTPDGKVRPLKMGDLVNKGDVILTTQDGLVQLSTEPSDTVRTAAARAAEDDLDRVIASVDRGDTEDAPAAGFDAGDGGDLAPGLRVGRIVEGTSPASLTISNTLGTTNFPVYTLAPEEKNLPLQTLPPGTPNDAPIATPSTATGLEDATLPLSLRGTDPDGTVVSVTVVSIPAGGRLLLADGVTPVVPGQVLTPAQAATLLFHPAPDFNGATSVVFTVTDDQGATSALESVAINVTPVNDLPVGTVVAGSGNEDTPIRVNLGGSDVDGTVTQVTVTTLPTNGTLFRPDGVTPVVAGTPLTPAEATNLVFQPAPNYNGSTSIVFTVTDNEGGVSAPVTVPLNVLPVNDTPVAAPDAVTVAEDTVATGNVLGNDTDIDGSTLSVTQFSIAGLPGTFAPGTIATVPGIGTLTIAPNGDYSFTPVTNYAGPVPVATYTVSDGTATTSSTLSIALTPVNDAPVALNDSAVTDEDTPLLNIPVLANDTDPDGDTLTVTTAASPNGVVTINPNGTLNFVPAPDFNGPTTITYTVTDGHGGTSTATVNVQVNPVVDPSITVGDVTVNEAAGTATFTVTLSQATTATVSVGYSTANGTATAGADYTAAAGTLTFAPGVTTQTITVPITNDAVFEGAETFTVNLAGAVNGVIADPTGLGTIRDDGTGTGGTDNDTPRVGGVSSPSVTEGGNLDFNVTLTNASTTPTTVTLARAGVTATVGTDTTGPLQVSFDGGTTFTAVAGSTVSVPAGVAGFIVRQPTLDDALSESNETLTLTASTPANTAPVTGTGTIVDNDGTPTLSVNDVVVNEAAGTATFTVTLSAPSGQPVSVGFNTSNGTATAGSDYTAITGTLTFAPGVTTQTVTVAITNDTVFESSETFNVNLTAPTNATLGDALGVGTIRDDGTGTGGTDNDTPALSVSSPTVSEGGGFAVFTVSLSNASATATTVTLGTTAGTATAGADYTAALQVSTDGGSTWAAASSATIAAGSTGVLVRAPIVNDALAESTEAFTLTATRTAGTTSNGAATGTATINDDDAAPTLAVNDVVVNEAVGTATFTVTLSSPSGLPVTVGYNTSNGTATAGSDYTAGTGTLTFAPGVTTQTITVAITNDAVYEGAETFNVNLTAPTNAAISDALGIGTIRDDGTGTGGTDNDTPSLSVSSPTVAEGGGFAVFTVNLSNASATATTVSLGTTAGTATAGADFTGALQVSTNGGATWAAATSATIAAGSTSVLVRAPIVQDTIDELDETFTLTATRTGGTTSNAAATGTATITDDDATPTLAVNDVVVNEAAGTATFTVTLSSASGLPVTVGFNTSNGTATAGTDYTAAAGTLTFAPGVTTQTVTVAITNDTVFEGAETFNVNLTTPTNATISDALGLGTIRDDGTGTGGTDNDTPALSVSSPTVAEGGGFAVFTVSLSNASTTATTVSLGTTAGTATAGSDYTTALQVSTDGGTTWAAASSATIAAGSTGVLVRAPIVNDALAESTEAFTLTATRTAGTTSNGAATGAATINDDDAPPTLAVNDVVVNEAAGTATFTVTLSGASGLPVTVGFNTSNGTATAGSDYTAATGTLTFAPGVTTQTVTVAVTNDAVYEGAETFNVNLTTPTNATISDALGVGSIHDDGTGTGGTDNDTPLLSVSSPTVAEGGGFAVFTVGLSNASTAATTVSLSTANGSATAGADYSASLQVSTDGGTTWAAASSATIAAGSTSVLVRAPITQDTVDELDESFTLTATRTAGTTSNAAATGTATITDDDATPTLAVNDVVVNEAAGSATFTVTLSSASGLPVSVGFNTSNGTATAGLDYTGTSGTLTFAPGVTTQTITVAITNDAVYEGAETFNVNLTTPTNATISDALGVGSIHDDGTGAGGTDNDTPSLSVSSPTVAEGGGFAVFTVGLSNASATATTVSLGTTAGTATAGADYTTGLQVSTDGGTTWAAAASATIAAGSTSVLVRAPIVDDALDEANETFALTATVTAGTTSNAAATGTATITDNDATPTLAINDVTVNEAAGTATFTVTLSAASGQPVTVGYNTGNGTATSGSDYTAVTGTLTFAPGVTTQTVTVSITNDTVFEGPETFNVNLTAPTNATISDALGVGTIRDDGTGTGGTDNDTPRIGSVSSPSIAEGGNLDFNVSLTNASTTPTTVTLTRAGVTATIGTDTTGPLQVSYDGGTTFSAVAGSTVSVPAGVSSFIVRQSTVDDAISEGNETLTLTASTPANTTPVAGTGTIVDNDGTPSLLISSPSVTEAAGFALFTVSLSNASATATTVSLATANGTATSPADYGSALQVSTDGGSTWAAASSVTLPAGATSVLVRAPIVDDIAAEAAETFSLVGTVTAGTTSNASATGIATITDEATPDATSVALSATPSVAEGGSIVYTATLSNAAITPVTVTLSNGATIAIAAGATTGTASVAAPADDVYVDAGTVSATIASATGGGFEALTVSPAAASTSVTDTIDTTTVNLAGAVNIVEGASGSYTLTLSNPAQGSPVTVNLTYTGTATNGADYTGVATVTIPVGATSATFSVASIDDARAETGESFTVTVASASGGNFENLAVGASSSVTTTITDEPTPDTVLVSLTGPASVTEGATTTGYTVSLGQAAFTPVTVNLTYSGTATDGSDFTRVVSVTVPAGATSATFNLATIDDTIDEANENIVVTLGSITGGGFEAIAADSAANTVTTTVIDNDATPTLSVNDVVVNEAAGTATFTVTLSAASGLPVSVGFNTSNGTATAGSDYTAATGTLTFAPGVTSQTITVAITNDTVFEGSESFNVNLMAPTNAALGGALGVGTIRDDATGTGGTDNDTPSLSVSSPSVAEGGGFAVFTLSLSNASASATTVSLATTAGTATAGSDYSSALQVSNDGGTTWAAASSATFAAGATSVLVRAPIVQDTIDELDESFTLTATRTAGTTSNAAATGTATITDDDATPTLAVNDVVVNEAAGTATFTVTLSSASGLPVTVGFNTSNGTATAGSDYTATTGTLTFAPGVTTQTVTVAITNDAVYEGAETFNVNLTTPTNATLSDALGVGTIRDDGTGAGGTDNDTPALSVSSPTVAEGGGFAVFTVSLSNASTTATTVSLGTAAGTATAGSDYTTALQVSTDGGTTWAAATSATIAAGSTSVLVRAPIVDDAINESSETFSLTATRTGGTTSNTAATGTATITDNDAAPSLSVNDVVVNEAAGTATFTVTLSGASGLPVTVGFNTSNGTATAGSDYTATTGTLTFAPGVTTQTVTVAITNDAVYEGAETFNVSLTTPTNATIGDALGVGTIRDDGTGAGGTDNDTPALSVSSPTVSEGGGFAVFTVGLSNASTTATTVSLGTTAGTATAGSDYTTALQVSTDGGTTWAAATSATIAAGSTSVLVRAPIVDDAINESSETFSLTATRTAGTTSNGAATGTATITDNDAAPSFSVNDVVVNEAAGTATFTVTLSSASGLPATVGFNTSNGTATAGSDYTATTGVLTFAPGVTTQTVTVAITNDAAYEGAETFNVNLTTPTNATISDALGIGTIRDDGTGTGGTDNDTPALSVSSPTVAEGGGFAVFTVSLSNASTTATTVSLGTAAGTATAGSDYTTALQVSTDGGTTWAAATSATIAAGSTSVLVRAPIVDDAINESSETFSLTATRTAGTTSNGAATGTATITDNDAAPSFSVNDVVVNEAAGTATFTVTLSSASGLPATVGFNTSNGTATAGSDYTATTGVLTFAPGVTTQTITVAITNDAVYEGAETFNVNLTTPTNATISDNLGLGTIRDDGAGTGGTDNDAPLVASISSPTVGEGGNLDFNVTLTNPSTTPTTVTLSRAGVTATIDTDTTGLLQVSFDGGATFTAVSGSTVSVPAGQTAFLVRQATFDDAFDENNETMTVSASTAANTTPVTGTGTITDNDNAPTLAINDVTVNEAAGTATFTVTMTGLSSFPVTVNYSTSNGTATAGSDYAAATGTLTFAPGVTTQTITVPITNDTVYEGSETFNVNLTSATNAVINDSLGVGTIRDDGTGAGGTDNDTPSLSVSSPTVSENGGFAVFTVSLSNASATATNLQLTPSAGTATAGSDYSNTLQVSTDGGTTWTTTSGATIAAGSTSVLVRAPIVNDAINEPTETFTLTATRTSGTTSNGSATGTATITDDDAAPTLAINDVTVNEAAGTATFTVTLTSASSLPVTVGYNTSNSTATAGSDYTAATGTLTFAPGVTTQTVTVAITNDAVYEGAETFNVNLTTSTNATISDNLGVGTIRDDGTGTGGTDNDTPSLSVSSPTVAEGGGFAVFTVSLSNAATAATTVSLATANGTASAGADYTTALQVSTDGGTTWAAATSATFAAGATSVLVRAPIVQDTIDEANETFTLTATRTAGTTSNTAATGTATITDDDATPTLAINDVTVNEAAGTATFTVTLSAASGLPVTVGYNTSNGTATAGSDYTAGTGTLTFAPGVTTQTITVSIANDAATEPSETFNVNLTAPTNATLSDALGVGTILDNDAPPVNTVPAAQSTPEDTALVFSSANGNPISVADADGGTLTTTLAVTNGVLTLGSTAGVTVSGNGTGSVQITGTAAAINVALNGTAYANTADYNGGATLTVTTTDGSFTDTDSVALTVTPVVDITNDTATTNEDNAVTLNVLANDSFENAGRVISAVNGSAITAGGPAVAVANGSVALVAGQLVYTPTANYNGAASFTYTVASGGVTETATVNVTVTAVNDAPVNAVPAAQATLEDTPRVFSAANGNPITVSDVDGNSLTTTIAVTNGTLSLGSTAGVTVTGNGTGSVQITGTAAAINAALSGTAYTNTADYNGGATLTVTTTDGAATDVDTVAITVTPVADIVADAAVTNEDTAVTINVLANDTFENGGRVISAVNGSAITAGGPAVAVANGTVALVAGQLVFTPTANYNGPTSFTYTVASGGVTETATVNVTVNSVNDLPLGRDVTISTLEDTSYTFTPANFLMNDVEDGNNVAANGVRIDMLPTTGTLCLNGVLVTVGQILSAADISGGTLLYTPNPNDSGTGYATLTFSVRDSSGGFDTVPNTVTVNVTPVDDGAPIAVGDAFQTTLGTPIVITQAQLLANDTLRDHASITSITAVSGGTLVNNGNGTYTYTPSATGNATFSYTLTDDDGQSSTAGVTINTVAARDDLATVHESALTGGTGGGTRTATGNVLTNDGGGTSITSVNGTTDGSGSDTDSRAGYIGVTTALGRLVVDSTGTGAGSYTYTLNDNANNSAAANDLSVTENFAYVSNATSATLRVTVIDDEPLVNDRQVQVSQVPLPSYGLVLVLDISGSMVTSAYGGEVRQVNADGTTSVTTRLALAKQALAQLVEEYYNQAQNVSVKIVTFSDTATVLNGNVAYTSMSAAVAAINGITGTASGGTNYQAALDAARTAFGTVDATRSNAAYFLSDGAPSAGNTATGLTAYNTFVTANGIDSYGVGIGTGISSTGPLDSIHNVDGDGDGVRDAAVVVPDLNQLGSALLSTVPTAYGGNVVSNGSTGTVLGADGGYVQTVTLRLDSNGDGTPDTDVTFTYNAGTNQITQNSAFLTGFPRAGELLTVGTGQGFPLGTLTFNFSSGNYTYYANGAASEGDSFSLRFVARDGDGDVTPSTSLTFNIANGVPMARPDTDTLMPNESHAEGNVISGLGTDGGLAIGTQVASFSAAGGGVDAAVDNAHVSSVTFLGQTFNLETNTPAGSGTNFTYAVSAGQLTLTGTGPNAGMQLVFNTSGFYDYTPPTSALTSTPTAIAVTNNFTSAANANTNGVTLTALTRTGTGTTINYSGNGAGVQGGSSNATLDNLERLVINFSRTTHPYGVQDVRFNIDAANSNLGPGAGALAGVIAALTYTVFDVSGAQIGQYYSSGENFVTLPADLGNIGRIEIEANSPATARVAGVTFESVLIDNAALAVAPVEVGYTLTDDDGQSSSSTLTLNVLSNNIFGDTGDNVMTGTGANDRMLGDAGDDTLNGGAGSDILEGGLGNDILNGGDGNDVLRGGEGSDTLNGGNGNDVLIGGKGNDGLAGGAGSDVFRWEFGDQGVNGSPTTDTITDFNNAAVSSGGDVLDLRDLLQGETALGSATGNLTSYLHFAVSGGNTTIQISSSGGFSGGFNPGAIDQSITLQGVDLSSSGAFNTDQQIIQDLLNKSKLVVDGGV